MSGARLTNLVGAALALAACAIALQPTTDAPARAELELSAAEGRAKIVNSKDGESIITAHNWAPGRRVKGRVAIRNAGSRPGTFRLSATRIRDSVLPGHKRLSRVMRIRVVRTRPARRGRVVVFKGKLRRLRGVRVGRWPAGGTRRFRIRATPRVGGDPNRYERSELTWTFRWRVRSH